MDVAWIEITSVCQNCKNPLNYKVVREDSIEGDNGILYKQYNQRPERCPKCGIKFCGIRTTKGVEC